MESNKTLTRQKQKKNIKTLTEKDTVNPKQTNKKTGKMNKGKEKKLKKEK